MKIFYLLALGIGVALMFCSALARGEELPPLSGREVEALALTLNAFKSKQGSFYQGSPVYGDLSHYTVTLERHGRRIDITFVPEQPKSFARGEAGTGGGTVYGWEVHYSVSLRPLKILKEDYAR
jgi:hypothetical protein